MLRIIGKQVKNLCGPAAVRKELFSVYTHCEIISWEGESNEEVRARRPAFL